VDALKNASLPGSQAGFPRVVIGENRTFLGEEELLRSRGVELIVLDDPECIALMEAFIRQQPRLWYEDIGESG
jgi:cytosine/creatinine deaminase